MLTAIRNLIRTLTLPNNARPGDPAIIIGPDLPPCMQSRYSAAIFFRPGTPFTGNAIDRPIKFIGLVNNNVSAQVDEGFALWDGLNPSSVCGYYAYKTTFASLAPLGSGNTVPQEYYGDIAQGGVATMINGGSTTFGSSSGGPPSRSWSVSIGGSWSPDLAPFFIDGQDPGRGPKSYGENNAPIGPSGAGVEMYGFASHAFDRWQRRAYRIRAYGWVTHSVAGAYDVRIRDGNGIGGAVLKLLGRVYNTAAGVPSSFEFSTVLKHTSATVAGSQVGFTLQSISGGTVTLSGAATQQPALEVRDWGDSTLYTDAENF